MDKKSYDLTEAIDFVLGDESEVEELLSDCDFEEDILDLVPANTLGNQSDSDDEENLPLQELVIKKEETMKKMMMKTQPKHLLLQPFQYTNEEKRTLDSSINRLLNLKLQQTHTRF